MRPSFSLRFILALGLFGLPYVSATAQTPTPPSAAPSRSCDIVHTLASEGDKALARKDYAAALGFFREREEKSPSEENTLGTIRSLVGLDKVSEAIAEADAAIKANPASALAEVARGEAAYRDADFIGMSTHASAAIAHDPCEARARDLAARYFRLRAMYASQAKYAALAHKLRPDDEQIRRDWIMTLFPKEQKAELEKYLGESPSLSDRDRGGYESEQQYLKAQRPRECHVSSVVTSTHLPLEPVFGDADRRVVAYGLDVKFNEKRRRMEIDTGASGIILTGSAASSLHLTPEVPLKVGGIGDKGEVESYITHVDKIQIGEVVFDDCLVTVLKKTYLGADGLIGMDVFGRWLLTLDYPNKELLLKELPPRPGDPPKGGLSNGAETTAENTPVHHDAVVPPGMEDWSHVVRIGHNILLPTTLNNSRLHYVIADTGSQLTALSVDFARAGGKTVKDDGMRFHGLQGEVKQTYRIDDASLTFGHFRLPKQTFYAFDITRLSHDEGVEVSGFLGIETLSRLTFSLDYRDNLINLQYDRKKDNLGVLR